MQEVPFPHPFIKGYPGSFDPPPGLEELRLMHWNKGVTDSDVSLISKFTDNLEFGGVTQKVIKRSAVTSSEHYPLIIRPVYEEILQRLLNNIETKNNEGLCIFGHPGSGKSTCLWFLLIVMLRLGKPVVFAYSAGRHGMLLFTHQFTTIVPLDYVLARDSDSPPLVILWDALAGPVSASLKQGYATMNHIVLATSPQIMKFNEWIKTGVKCITVDCFTREEVKWLSLADPEKWKKPDDCHDVLTLYAYLGPSLHGLLMCETLKHEHTSAAEDLAVWFDTAHQSILQEDTKTWIVASKCTYEFETLLPGKEPSSYHQIFTVSAIDEPGSEYRWWIRPRFAVRLATPFIAALFFGAIHLKTFMEIFAFVTQFGHESSVRALLFEVSSIRFLSWSPRATVIEIPSGPNISVPSFIYTAEKLLQLAPFQDLENTAPRPLSQVLHVAPPGQPTIDALYEDASGTIFMFQMTIAKKHGISASGLDRVLACYRNHNEAISFENFVLVFVVPDEATKQLYMTKYTAGYFPVKVKKEVQHLRIGVLVIDDVHVRTLQDLMVEHKRAAHNTVDENGNLLPPVVEFPLPASQSTASQISPVPSPVAPLVAQNVAVFSTASTSLQPPTSSPLSSPLNSILVNSVLKSASSTSKAKKSSKSTTPSKSAVEATSPLVGRGAKKAGKRLSSESAVPETPKKLRRSSRPKAPDPEARGGPSSAGPSCVK